MKAIIAVLREFGRISIAGAIERYAPASDGNDPQAYAATLAKKVGVGADSLLTDLDEDQMGKFILEIKRVEGWQEGTKHNRGCDMDWV